MEHANVVVPHRERRHRWHRERRMKVPRWVYPDGKHTLATFTTGTSVFPRILTIKVGKP